MFWFVLGLSLYKNMTNCVKAVKSPKHNFTKTTTKLIFRSIRNHFDAELVQTCGSKASALKLLLQASYPLKQKRHSHHVVSLTELHDFQTGSMNKKSYVWHETRSWLKPKGLRNSNTFIFASLFTAMCTKVGLSIYKVHLFERSGPNPEFNPTELLWRTWSQQVGTNVTEMELKFLQVDAQDWGSLQINSSLHQSDSSFHPLFYLFTHVFIKQQHNIRGSLRIKPVCDSALIVQCWWSNLSPVLKLIQANVLLSG